MHVIVLIIVLHLQRKNKDLWLINLNQEKNICLNWLDLEYEIFDMII